jgi:hypothetical protein
MSQHDYVIANASGATVRADLNSLFQAMLSQNSGTSAPTQTAAGMFWLDTTGGAPYTLKIRDAGNNHWLTVLSLTDPGSDGNVSVSSIEGTSVLSTGESGTSKYLRIDGDGSCSWQTVYTPKAAVIVDQKSSGTAGGTFTSGAWRTRDLNTEISDADSIVSISSNQFTLGAGTYLITWVAPSQNVGLNQSKLYDITGSADLALGISEYNGSQTSNHSFGSFIHSPSGSNTYEIQHRCATTNVGGGFGTAASFGNEIYTRVTINKL